MNTKLHLICTLAAGLTLQGAAMPTAQEVENAKPSVQKLLDSEWAALESGKKTRAEVAEAALKLADEADTDAAKLLLMKGAFVLYVKDGNLDKAVKTMNALESAIADMPPQVVTNIIETALLGVSNKKENGARLYRLLDEVKGSKVADGGNLKAVVDGYTWTYRISKGDGTVVRVEPGPNGCVTIPSTLGGVGVKSVGEKAFWNCQGLKSVTIPESVTNVGSHAFRGCEGLTSVTIPASVVSVGSGAFSCCTGLRQINVAEGNQRYVSVDGVLWTKDRTELVAFPCGLKTVTMLESAMAIGSHSFKGCRGIATVTIPSNVKSIGVQAFLWCGELTSVTMLGERPEAPNNVFQGCHNLKAIHVPANAKSWAGMKEWQGIPLVFDGKSMKDSSPAVRQAVESILKGMIKVPGRDFWLSATELTQEQWEPIMGFNLSEHKGAKLPVEMVSRDDCDVFLEKLNQTKEVQESQFEFCLPKGDEWLYAAQAGSGEKNCCWIKPGVVGNALDMAWVKENSSNETHDVAMKAANAFGFYDMLGNVWEWLSDSERERGVRRGHAFCEEVEKCSLHNWINTPRNRRWGVCGLRLAAHARPQSLLRRRLKQGQSDGLLSRQEPHQQATVNGYTWTYRVNNGEAEIVAEKGGKFSCAVSPMPTGNLAIPSALGGAKVTSIGRNAFYQCRGLTSVAIPSTVTNIGRDAFNGCHGLTSPAIPSSVKDIGVGSFLGCGVTSVTISANVVNIGCAAFAECAELKEINVEEGNQKYVSDDGVLYTKDRTVLMQCPGGTESVTLPEGLKNIYWHALRGCRKLKSVTIPSSVREIGPWAFDMCGGLTSVVIPSNVASIGWCAFCDCSGLKSVTIPSSVTSIGEYAFFRCGKLTSVTIPRGVTSIGKEAFYGCGELSSVTMLGERPNSPDNVFPKCAKLKAIHVPANAKSWAGMKEWQGIPLVFDAK